MQRSSERLIEELTREKDEYKTIQTEDSFSDVIRLIITMIIIIIIMIMYILYLLEANDVLIKV